MFQPVSLRPHRFPHPPRAAWLLGGLVLLFAGWNPGCSPDSSTAPTARSLDVRVIFSENASPHVPTSLGSALRQPISQMTARAIATMNDERAIEDEETVEIRPSDARFRIPLSVRPAEYPAHYIVEVEASGVRELNGSMSEFGLLYLGAGQVDLAAESPQVAVNVDLVGVVPLLQIDVQSDQVVLSWSAVEGAVRYRVRETVGEVSEESETTSLGMAFRFDTAIESRSYRVSSVLAGGRTGAYSEASGTTGSHGQLDLTVVDAQSGDPLAGATATLGTLSAATDGNGFVRFEDLTPGMSSLVVSLDGYITNTRPVEIVSGLTTTVRVGLSRPLENGYRIVLAWGQDPQDLDSHLLTPAIEDSVYHVYYSNRGSADAVPFALLDLDDTDGFGPETTTIAQSFPGVYSFHVHNWSGQNGGEPFLAGSGAQVALYKDAELLTTVTVPASGTGIWWNVLTLDAVVGAFDVVNELVDTDPTGAPALRGVGSGRPGTPEAPEAPEAPEKRIP